MQKVLIIGGGLSGLSAAVHLTRNNIPVTLIEAAPRLGGRVSSFYDNSFGEVIDNGQHIMMGCYSETLKYLNIINARQNFYFQEDLEVVFYNNGKEYILNAGRGVYPFSLLAGLLSFKLLDIRDRINLARFFINLPVASVRDIENCSAEKWLIDNNQGEYLRSIFWNTFIIGALNTTASRASALVLRNVLIRVFFSGRRSSAIIIPGKPLTEAFCEPAVTYVKQNNSDVSCSERVLKLVPDNKRNIISAVTSKRTLRDFTHVIAAVPLHQLKKIIPMETGEFKPEYSPILTVHFKSRVELFPYRFIAVTESPIHWIFRHTSHYTIVVSSAEEFLETENNRISQVMISELVKQFNIRTSDVTSVKVIKEKRATFVPSKEIFNTRPGHLTPFRNLYLAGDWINTGLPATIEGAILSGRKAAAEIQVIL